MKSLVRIPRAGGAPSASVEMDAGRPGVSRIDFAGASLPGGRGKFVDVVLDDERGWHYSVGVLDPKTIKVKVLDDDGGNARYKPTGHLVFSRGDAILAARFDLGRLEMRGAPVAIWSGLRASAAYVAGPFDRTRDGALVYLPGQLGSERPPARVDAAGRTTPWNARPRAMLSVPILSPDGRRFASRPINTRGIDEIWISSVDHDALERVRPEPNADSFDPTWSPGGRRLAYRRHGKDGKDGVCIIDIETGEIRRVLTSEAADGVYNPNSRAPDGSGLLLTHNPPGGAVRVAYLPAPGGCRRVGQAAPGGPGGRALFAADDVYGWPHPGLPDGRVRQGSELRHRVPRRQRRSKFATWKERASPAASGRSSPTVGSSWARKRPTRMVRRISTSC